MIAQPRQIDAIPPEPFPPKATQIKVLHVHLQNGGQVIEAGCRWNCTHTHLHTNAYTHMNSLPSLSLFLSRLCFHLEKICWALLRLIGSEFFFYLLTLTNWVKRRPTFFTRFSKLPGFFWNPETVTKQTYDFLLFSSTKEIQSHQAVHKYRALAGIFECIQKPPSLGNRHVHWFPSNSFSWYLWKKNSYFH